MSYAHIPLGEKAPQEINVVIGIPAGSSVKYEYDEELDAIVFDRLLYSPMFYPTNYGFAPETRSGDGDHLDVLVYATVPLTTGTIVKARVIGALDMTDDAGVDTKIIAVAVKDPYFKEKKDLDSLEPHALKALKHFFEVYKDLENKEVNVGGFKTATEAHKLVEEGVAAYAAEHHE